MPLVTIDRPERPTRARTSSLPDDDQAALLALAGSDKSVSDGKAYKDASEARKASGPYRRFLRGAVNDGRVTGKVRTATFATGKDGKQVGWAVYLEPAPPTD